MALARLILSPLQPVFRPALITYHNAGKLGKTFGYEHHRQSMEMVDGC